ncbi:DUF4297 domain-containing protein [Rhodobacteraceae bacterium]|nr:DUF4297 domain-containing protein [Paracoccaceae bacterium]
MAGYQVGAHALSGLLPIAKFSAMLQAIVVWRLELNLIELKQKMTSTPQREDSGAKTNSRYHYQALCGLVLVMEKHKLGGDYAIVFEFHDDIAVFDDPIAPSSVEFYQVKSKASGNWTPASLTKRDKAKGDDARSFLGKMYENVISFGDNVKSATFLSNAPANFAPDSKQKFCLTECDGEKLAEITKRLEEEFSGEDAIKSELLWVSRTDLSLDDADTHARGKLEAFVVENLGSVEFSLRALYQAISDECDSKSRAASADLTDFSDVISKRGITRADANSWLENVRSTVECPRWEDISSEIHLPALQKIRLSREWNTYRVAVLNPNEAIRKVRRRISDIINEGGMDSLSLNDLMLKVYAEIEAEARLELKAATDEQIMVMVLYETHSVK